MNKITILGSGTSTGVPILGCNCGICQSTDTRNKRLRTSALIEFSSGKKLLIDASPDLRTQLLFNKISHVDAAIITHDHADHTHGLDDLRPFSFVSKEDIPIFTDAGTAKSLRKKFSYIFERDQKPILGGGIPLLKIEEITTGPQKILGEDFTFFSLPHGHGNSLGFCHDKMAYLIDCREIPPEVIDDLKSRGLDLLIIDCLRPQPHQTHLHLDKSLEYIQAINPRLSLLTHMGHEWDYMQLLHELQVRSIKNVQPALDAQSFLYPTLPKVL
jgi:phosphoribosyl 1,2-cyclic phosphate phosphodiesterase